MVRSFGQGFVIKNPPEEINAGLLEYGILGGFNLGEAYGSSMANDLLIAVTEMNMREDIETLAEALEEVTHD